MGYTTSFHGKAEINPPLTAGQILYIRKFCNTRRMKRDPALALQLPDPLGKALNMPIGDEAGYFVGGTGHSGQDRDPSVLDFNRPPVGQPGLWCSWEVTDDGRYLQWSGAEKFYDYVEWLRYLIEHFFSEWGCVLNGEIGWCGEGAGDTGVIEVQGNIVSSRKGSY